MTRMFAALLVLTLTVAGCAENASTASDPGPTETATPKRVPITPGGIAAVVQEVLGADRVAGFQAGGEEDTVALTVRLAGAAREVLAVSVLTNGEAPIASCADLRDRMPSPGDCEVSEDGTILASEVGEAFSDDNVSGSTVRARAVNPGAGRVVFALYETYAERPSLDPATLSAIVSDKRLAALTDPTTNEAGAGLDVEAAQ